MNVWKSPGLWRSGLERGSFHDAGVGTGRNFVLYPADAKVVAIDLSPAMLARAQRRVASTPAKVELRRTDVTRLDFAANSFDAAVASFLFCVLPEEQQLPALAELGRVVKPGGIIRLIEYTRPFSGLRRLVTQLWEPWVFWAYGASFDRRTGEHVSQARAPIPKFASYCSTVHLRTSESKML